MVINFLAIVSWQCNGYFLAPALSNCQICPNYIGKYLKRCYPCLINVSPEPQTLAIQQKRIFVRNLSVYHFKTVVHLISYLNLLVLF
jgi:hypothetical protein